MKVTGEAIEAAAQGIASANLRRMPWSRMSEEARNHFRRDARAALEAAAPYLMAQAWDECEAAKYEIRLDPTSRFWEPYKINPYRKDDQ